jgi:hypothetical protein
VNRNKHVRELVEKWRAEVTNLRNLYFDERVSRIVARLADELNQALESDEAELLTLEQAAGESGYSAEHLGRMVRTGRVANGGRAHAPRIRRADLPLKTSRLRTDEASLNIGVDRTEIARSIVTQVV